MGHPGWNRALPRYSSFVLACDWVDAVDDGPKAGVVAEAVEGGVSAEPVGLDVAGSGFLEPLQGARGISQREMNGGQCGAGTAGLLGHAFHFPDQRLRAQAIS